jgi:hypothetical protein
MVILLKILVFLFWGNFLPPLADMVLGPRLRRPLDNGCLWLDGYPLFGPNKTMRGIGAGILGCTMAAPLLGLPFQVAAGAAILLMAGDLLSSFVKRRLGLTSGTACFGLDQLFEGLFPGLYLLHHFDLPAWQTIPILLVFMPVAHSGACFWKNILYKPPMENYQRIIRSTVRLREWRSCHEPLARWQTMFNLSTFLYNRVVVSTFFRIIGRYEQGLANAGCIKLTEKELAFAALPQELDGFRLLLLTDLHLDGVPGLTDKVLSLIGGRPLDLCLVGGDIRMNTYGPIAPCLRELRRLLGHITSVHGIYGVLGNHDCIEMVPDFEEAGMLMLVNDAAEIRCRNSALWVAGIDDPHYYKCHDPAQALGLAPPAAFTIFLAHSPEVYREAAVLGADLYLCGHTHGGQICLRNGKPIYTNSRAPRFTAVGHWRHGKMQGYTSRGVGASGAPLRFNCPGEITLFTLRCASPTVISASGAGNRSGSVVSQPVASVS